MTVGSVQCTRAASEVAHSRTKSHRDEDPAPVSLPAKTRSPRGDFKGCHLGRPGSGLRNSSPGTLRYPHPPHGGGRRFRATAYHSTGPDAKGAGPPSPAGILPAHRRVMPFERAHTYRHRVEWAHGDTPSCGIPPAYPPSYPPPPPLTEGSPPEPLRGGICAVAHAAVA